MSPERKGLSAKEAANVLAERDALKARAEAAELARDEERDARDALLAEVIRETGAGTATTNPEFGPQSEAEAHVYKREELRARVLSLVAQAERRPGEGPPPGSTSAAKSIRKTEHDHHILTNSEKEGTCEQKR